MSERVLVVEYEPRYTERIREALTGGPAAPVFARDGDEALALLESTRPRLIVLSSVLPRYGTGELIRKIRGSSAGASAPILLTVSGYTGDSPRADAGKIGATDILTKPFTASQIAGKISEMLGFGGALDEPADETVRYSRDDLMGTVTAGAAPAESAPPARERRTRDAMEDLDRIVADTLSGIRSPRRRTDPSSRRSAEELDRLLEDTLSGLESTVRAKSPPTVPDSPPSPRTETTREAPRPPQPASSGTEALDDPTVSGRADPTVSQPLDAEPVEPVEGKLGVSSPLIVPAPDAGMAAEPEVGEEGARFGQYLLVEKIATGGMAEVWKARMLGVEGFEKVVAIKKILPHLSDNQEFVEMFIDEAKLAAQLNHNNIIHIYDLGKIARSYYIAMEYIEGHDLKSILRRGQERAFPLPVELALLIGSKLAAALDHAHRRRGFDDRELGIVHRDVSPQNVLISYEGDIKLCDFGIAKAATKASNTNAGALKGKLQYMSPEQAWGRPIDQRSDLFSFSAVLFELLTGRKLFAGDSELSILDQVREAAVPVPSTWNDELTDEIDAVVMKGLARDPEERYQSAAEVVRDVDRILFAWKPTPTPADLAIYMHRLYRFEEEAAPPPTEVQAVPIPVVDQAHPTVVDAPVIPATIAGTIAGVPEASPPTVVQQSIEELGDAFGDATIAVGEPSPSLQLPVPAPAGRKRMALVGIAVGLLLVAAVGAGAYFVLQRGRAPALDTSRGSVPAVAGSTRPSFDEAADGSGVITPEAAIVEDQGTGDLLGEQDLALIDQEVQRRLAEERAKLEQQNRSAEDARRQARPERGPNRRDPAPAQETVAARSEPAPAEPSEPGPAPAETASTEPAREVREGDLVPPGTPGLVDPELISIRKVAYPRMAKLQRIEGVVIVRVLVSETGQVLQSEILRGVTANVGINEAATEMAGGARFKPATKDGIRVRAYTTLTIPFKL